MPAAGGVLLMIRFLLLLLWERFWVGGVVGEVGGGSRVALGLEIAFLLVVSVVATLSGNGVVCAGGMLNLSPRPSAGVVTAGWEGMGKEGYSLKVSARRDSVVVPDSAAAALALGCRKEATRIMLRMMADRREGIISSC